MGENKKEYEHEIDETIDWLKLVRQMGRVLALGLGSAQSVGGKDVLSKTESLVVDSRLF